jgi:hypothetical protein
MPLQPAEVYTEDIQLRSVQLQVLSSASLVIPCALFTAGHTFENRFTRMGILLAHADI